MNTTIKVGIVGATGYTGVELLRLLSRHPQVQVTTVTSRSESGLPLSDLFPSLRGVYDGLSFLHPEHAPLHECDVVFFATPNGIAMKQAPALLAQGVRVVDLSADYRIRDVTVWEAWYKMTHASPDYIAQAIYGLPEMNRESIRNAHLIANPGCYPTCVTIPLLPLLQQDCLLAQTPIIADCKSGVSGAGRKAAVANLFSEAGDNFKAYGVTGHRHLPEIRQNLNDLRPGHAEGLVFVPHLTPLIRGMHATLYVQAKSQVDLHQVLNAHYADNLFVDVLPLGCYPETRSVRAANICRIAVQKAPQQDNMWIILSVIDNLVKGAAGQAVQNMNIMFALPEKAGLDNTPVLP